MWSEFENVINDRPKTSNSLEGWHRSLNSLVNQKSPSFLKIFQTFQIEQNFNESKLLQSLYANDIVEVI
jgi:hypothetical protein